MSDITERYLLWLQRLRYPVFFIILLLTGACILSITTLHIETDWVKLFPYSQDMPTFRALNRLGSAMELVFRLESRDHSSITNKQPAIQQFTENIKQTGLFDDLKTGDHSMSTNQFVPGMTLFLGKNGVDTLIQRLQQPGMKKSVDGLMNMMFSPAAGFARHLLENDPLQVSVLAASTLQTVSGYTMQDGLILSSDGSHALIIAIPPPDPPPDWTSKLAAAIPELKKQAGEYGLICRMPGSRFLNAEIFESVKQDLIRTSLISLLLVILLFALVYRRSPGAIICVVFPQVTALALTFGFYRIFTRDIGLITSMAAAMLTGLGVDFGIHLMSRYKTEQGTIHHRLKAALANTGRGNAAGALTTAIAFFVILATGMQSFYLLGCTAGIGILLSLLSYVTVFPVLVFILKPFPNPQPQPQHTRLRYQPFFTAAGIVLIITAGIALPFAARRWTFSSDLTELIPRTSRIYQDMKAIGQMPSGKQADALMIEMKSRGLHSDALFAYTLRQPFSNAAWRTPFQWIPDAEQLAGIQTRFFTAMTSRQITPGNAADNLYRIYNGHDLVVPARIHHYIPDLFLSFQTEQQQTFFARLPFSQPFYSDSGQQLFLLATQTNHIPWTSRDIRQIEQQMQQNSRTGKVTTSRRLLTTLQKRVIRESIYAACIALALITTLLKLYFRRWRMLLFALIPLGCGLLFTTIIMGIFRIPFNFFNITVLPLVFGLGIDDGIHFMQAYKENKNAERALLQTIRPIITTTGTTCIGFGALTAVSFYGIFSMGLVIVIGMLSCLASILFILPPLIKRMDGGGVDG